ncbi:iron ABC transporter permease [Carnobacteriaceae bacterium zg-ZUI78]|uniref:FecCD family ABC transporter permease n=1 Tax=Granulicatella sp. zg-84 TaxID=2678503 RepID=UPI0013C2153E|nr:iron ABC transporter permease [Granulicatella sp. zg-84]MBS4749481.1 iron ABC transporter permease [Carnobacteriaceae bacterium zg-ZUI78]NEW66675.1 iron chelate uptake ABC transporter family permease subunit [Granulicatella sp. zg-84]QMI85020.1 iron ABC transporter permease [Carnobacteriaceae bacterium zg-84]
MNKQKRLAKPILWAIILFVGLIVSILTAITFGNADLSISDVYSVIGYELFHFEQFQAFATGATHDIVWLIRFPRVILALTIGMGLSVCGVVMQSVVKNPLADPYILGISSGASFGATLAILFGIGSVFGANAVGVMAFIGALITSLLVLLLANLGGRTNLTKIILSGLAVSAICSAFSNFVIYIANDKSATVQIMFWLMGSMASAKWHIIAVVLPIMLVGTLVFWSQYRQLNVMLLGDDTAITLGMNTQQLRRWYIILSSLMVGFAVYAAGVIGFVGLVIPHAVRLVFGSDHKYVIPFSALVGSIFVIWADVMSRIVLRNSEMPIGILISLIGAPCFIFLMIRHTHRAGGK